MKKTCTCHDDEFDDRIRTTFLGVSAVRGDNHQLQALLLEEPGEAYLQLQEWQEVDEIWWLDEVKEVVITPEDFLLLHESEDALRAAIERIYAQEEALRYG